ncbi:MAG TPA: hypothetical protein V6D17_12925 [Candidatus Obscuribacterales bacterium]
MNRERFLHHFKEYWQIVAYLIVSLSILATFRGLVLLQHGDVSFTRSYAVCAVESLIIAKVVLLTQGQGFVNAWKKKPIIASVAYKSIIMSAIVLLATSLEESIRHGHSMVAAATHPIILILTHYLALLLVFVPLFSVKELEEELGPGTLRTVFFGPRTQRRAQERTADGATEMQGLQRDSGESCVQSPQSPESSHEHSLPHGATRQTAEPKPQAVENN